MTPRVHTVITKRFLIQRVAQEMRKNKDKEQSMAFARGWQKTCMFVPVEINGRYCLKGNKSNSRGLYGCIVLLGSLGAVW